MQFLHTLCIYETCPVMYFVCRQTHSLPMAEEQFSDERPHSGDIRRRPRHRNAVAAAHHAAGAVLLHDLKKRVALAQNRIRFLLILKLDNVCCLRQRQPLLYKILDGRARCPLRPFIKEQHRFARRHGAKGIQFLCFAIKTGKRCNAVVLMRMCARH